MHLALLALLVFGFSRAPKFEDAPESIPIETITSTQLNEIMEGEKHGKPAAAPAKPAPAPTQPAPSPPTPPERPAPPPPEPPQRPEPPPPEPPPPEPPQRPEPAKPEPPPPEPPKRPEPPKPLPPKPPPPKPLINDAPTPPVKPHVAEQREDAPRPPEKPRVAEREPQKPAEKFKPDEIARELAQAKPDEKSHPKPPAFDSAAISKMIGQAKTADASPAPAPQGLANHHAPRMSVSLENALNEWFRDSYKNCWNLPPSNPAGDNYVFDVRVIFKPDGSLASRPVLLNPPHDPEWRAHADSVMRAVMRCNPLHVPAQYAPYFEQWRSKTIHFDPSSAEG